LESPVAVAPEVLLACLEFVERLSVASAHQPLVNLIADWRTENYDVSHWKYRIAYEKNSTTVKKILDEALKGVNVPRVKVVPFVLVVMTDAEAEELKAETVLASNGILLGHYKNVLAKANAAGVQDWAERYGPRAEHWRPFDAAGKGQTIA